MTGRSVPAPVRALVAFFRTSYPWALVVVDLVGFVAAFGLAALFRREVGANDLNWVSVFVLASLMAALFVVIGGWIFQLYRNRYRVATFDELYHLGMAWLLASMLSFVIDLTFFDPRVPTSIVGMGMMLAGASMLGTRVLWRLVRRNEVRPDPEGRTRVLIFGAGSGGEQAIKSMLTDPASRYVPVGVLDDDPRKQNRSIEGVRVVGTRQSVGLLSERADLLLIAVPSASAELVAEVAAAADDAGLEVMILPNTTELFGMMVSIDAARPLEITDLLGRSEVTIDDESVAGYLRGETVLVTGAGGSIGAELCHQILRYEPARVIMLDRDETALQSVQLTVAGHGLLDDETLVLGDIRDRDRVFEVFERWQPSVVFHAAALKHLPLLESYPREALLSNVVGTKHVLDAATATGVERFVNISTDKAANPQSVLGTTKRLAEGLTARAGERAAGTYLSVRFGNVLGSRGSVLPAFESQIAAGKPVTVTHPDVTRYFMSIPEACRLVLQAGAIGTTGETLVLDMGEPLRILDLAEKLIRHRKANVEIVFTGLRANEKLHEELGHDGEIMQTRDHPRIWHVGATIPGPVDLDWLIALAPAELPAALQAATMEVSMKSAPRPASSG